MAKKPYFEPVDPKVNFPGLEEKIIKFWDKEKIFEKSISARPENQKWTFLDGPPFITGLPHYGSLLSSIPKDLFPRYKTMRGFRVRRVWGWDCHGLPAENKVEARLGLKTKKEIETKIGIKKFIEECKLYVSQTSSEWKWYIDHIARWVDFDNAYRTMDKDYMESVMWVFKKMYDQSYIYKGLRVSLYCPHCGTPISNFEVAMDADNYKELSEPATTYKYALEGEKSTFLLAWSTTPWNKIATPALAVNPKLKYVLVKEGNEKYILAQKTLKKLNSESKSEIIRTFSGQELVGKKFVPHYDYYRRDIKTGEKVFEVIPADFVSAKEGTGIVTLAVYGEEDMGVMKKHNVHLEMHVTDDGYIKKDVPKFGGLYYLDANEKVDADLQKRGLIYKTEKINHSIPHCWRCGTRLFHNPQNAWFVDVQSLKPAMKKNNEKVNWVPSHFKYGRFLKSMEAAPDWCISRSRYWGSPVPVWECACGEKYVPGSIKELEKLSGKKVNDLHKPEIDTITIKCLKCKREAKRVPEVLDSWIEAGSASFAERHFPFEKDQKETKPWEFFPPHFVVEYTGQIRAWFYVLHVISTALYDSPAFENVVVTGVILGTDGRKMSKNFGNYPDPKKLLQLYGGDALRLYLLGSPVMRGEDILISEEDYRNNVRGFLIPYWNVYNFFVTYANLNDWKPKTKTTKSKNVLDEWILSRMQGNIENMVKSGYEKFNTPEIVSQAFIFLSDLSNWYVRRSRERFNPNSEDDNDRKAALETLWLVLTTYTQALAPLIPFTAEKIYKNLTKKVSVHLTDWPEEKGYKDEKLEKQMEDVRKLAEKTHAIRKEEKLPVRQPLSFLATVSTIGLPPAVSEILKEETNVLDHKNKIGKEIKVETLDTKLTSALKKKGWVREIIRDIQIERRNLGTSLDEKVNVFLPDWPEEFEAEIKTKAQVGRISKGNFKVIRTA